jgi:hypothetical protein
MKRNWIATRDQIWQPLYDVTKFDTLPQSRTFFEKPQGMIGADLLTKNREDTNVYVSNQLLQGNEFYLTSIGVYFVPNCERDAGTSRAMDIMDTLTVLSMGSFELRVANRIYLDIAPLAALPPPFPMYWAHDDARLEKMLYGDVTAAGDGVPVRKLDDEAFKIKPLYIPAQQYFGAFVRFKKSVKLNSLGKLGVILYGYLIREAQ